MCTSCCLCSMSEIGLVQVQPSWGNVTITIAGLTNTYSSYVTTFEEYQAQRYEGASTIFGPHTLDAYIQVTCLPLLSSSPPSPLPPCPCFCIVVVLFFLRFVLCSLETGVHWCCICALPHLSYYLFLSHTRAGWDQILARCVRLQSTVSRLICLGQACTTSNSAFRASKSSLCLCALPCTNVHIQCL